MNNPEPQHAYLRGFLLSLTYGFIFASSLWTSYLLRFDFSVPDSYTTQFLQVLTWIIPLKLISLWVFGQYKGLLTYFSIPDLRRIIGAVTASSIIIAVTRVAIGATLAPPRGIILSDFVLSVAGVCAVRLVIRTLRERYFLPESRPRVQARRVAIVGAGDVGAALALELIRKRWLGMHPIAFFDDYKGARASVHGVPVVGRPEALGYGDLDLARKLNIQEVIIAMPSAPAKRIAEIVRILQELHLKVQTVPSMAQLATGDVKASMLRAVEIQDLLGRPPVVIETENIQDCLGGRVVMVTGAGGSIGSELCRQIVDFAPRLLLLIERSEPQLFLMEQELEHAGYRGIIVPLIADVLDGPRMQEIFRSHAPEIIFHAAAHKHVPMMETQPSEAIKNNVFGTAQLARLALKHQVERFILISTDKAINPTSVLGASKRLAELFLQSFQSQSNGHTKFIAVRFGNVLGSSGSVVPTFAKQIAAGGPVTVTHPEVTRYFMTIPEAVSLVLQSGAQGVGGEIFVLDMATPVKIMDVARQMIQLSGLRPDVDIEIAITGLRPGEKLFEELSHIGEDITSTHHPKIMRFLSDPLPLEQVEAVIADFWQCLDRATPAELKAKLKAIIPEYAPYGENYLSAPVHVVSTNDAPSSTFVRT